MNVRMIIFFTFSLFFVYVGNVEALAFPASELQTTPKKMNVMSENHLKFFESEKLSEYKSGRAFCMENSSKLKSEIAHWVSVPKFYHRPELGTTEIYAYTLKPLDHQYPTLLFFIGGPGTSSRTTPMDLSKTNIIYFEPRGVSCSRPDSRDDFYNPAFYSSEAIARDAREILKSLGISLVSVYGHSYGTIAATIFASYFPEYTKNLILEGVISQANQSLIQSSLKQKYLQQFFNSLDLEMQDKIIDLGSRVVPANWFSKVGNMMLYLNSGLVSYRKFLDVILSFDEGTFKQMINSFYYPAEEDALYFSQVTFGMLSCQETLAVQKDLSTYLVFNEKKKLRYDRENSFSEHHCEPLDLNHHSGDFYSAAKYPVQAPVFYFLGETDGTTDLEQGLYHYKNVPQKERHLLVMKEGGHLPNLNFIKENRPCNRNQKDNQCEALKPNQLQTEIFNSIVHFNSLDYDRIAEFNRIVLNTWDVQSKLKHE